MELTSQDKGFVKWAIGKSPHLSYMRKWILNDYGSYQNLEAELAGYIWEYGSHQGKSKWLNYLTKTYQTEYRRNVARFNLWDTAAGKMGWDGDDDLPSQLLHSDLDDHGFSTLGNWNIDLAELPSEAGSDSDLVVGPDPGGSLAEPSDGYWIHLLNNFSDEDNTYSLDGKDMGSSRHKLKRWLGRRTEQEMDILTTWANLAPVSYAEVAEFCDVERDEVERVIGMLLNWANRYRDVLNKSER